MRRTSFRVAILASSISALTAASAQGQEATESEKEVELREEAHWYDNLTIGAFVDAYGALRSDNNHTHNSPSAVAGSVASTGNLGGLPGGGAGGSSGLTPSVAGGLYNPGSTGHFGHDAYVQASGFALAFAGADIAYSGDKFGATISLRFGPGINRFYGSDQSQFGIQNITQAYATWKPTERLTLDLGQWYTIYGAEVAESWRNMNYTRGGLYYAMQPFWHTGLRANYKLNDKIAFNAMVVDGVNTAFEGNKSPTVGGQVLLTPTDELFIAAGGMFGLNPRDGDDETIPTKNFQDFFDVVTTYTHGNFKVVGNADLNVYRQKGEGKKQNWWGVSAAPGYSFTNWFGVAGRVEYLQDSKNVALCMPANTCSFHGKTDVVTLTGTLDFKPIPNASWVILRPEFRYERANKSNYTNWSYDQATASAPGNTKNFWLATLGVVVTSMP